MDFAKLGERDMSKEDMSLDMALKIIGDSDLAVSKNVTEKNDMLTEAEMGTEDSIELYSFGFNSLLLADKIHGFHLGCQSGFHHTHLQTVYETLRDFADSLSEITLSGGVAYQYEPMTDIVKPEPFTIKNAVDTIDSYIDDLEEMSSRHKDNTRIANLIDDTIEKLSKEVGLLRTFK